MALLKRPPPRPMPCPACVLSYRHTRAPRTHSRGRCQQAPPLTPHSHIIRSAMRARLTCICVSSVCRVLAVTLCPCVPSRDDHVVRARPPRETTSARPPHSTRATPCDRHVIVLPRGRPPRPHVPPHTPGLAAAALAQRWSRHAMGTPLHHAPRPRNALVVTARTDCHAAATGVARRGANALCCSGRICHVARSAQTGWICTARTRRVAECRPRNAGMQANNVITCACVSVRSRRTRASRRDDRKANGGPVGG